MTKLPEVYTPSWAKRGEEKLQDKFGLGIEHAPNSFGMIQGPFDTLEEALECDGGDNKTLILRLPQGEKLYEWDYENTRWVRVLEKHWEDHK